jgi:MFS family permease
LRPVARHDRLYRPAICHWQQVTADAPPAQVRELFTPEHRAEVQVWSGLYFAIGLTVFGIFGSFTYYLPELFPTRLRATGCGFCYNTGRLITAIGPFLVGYIASHQANVLQSAFSSLFIVGFIPLLGVAVMPWILETKDRTLMD